MRDATPNELPDDARLRDVSARQAALAAALIAASPDCLKRLDLDGNLLWIGEAESRQLGIDDVEPHLNTCWFGWWDGVERGKVERAVAEGRAGRASRFEAWATMKSGEARCWSVHVHPIVDAMGRPVELLAASRDVTALRAQTALSIVHRRRSLADKADDRGSDDYAIFGLDTDGRIESWNAAAETVFGWRAADVIGKDGDPIWTPEDRAAGVPTSERNTAARLGVARDERWHMRGDGSRVFVDGVMIARTDADGRVGGFVKICRDETTHRVLADELAAVRRGLNSALIAGEIGTFDWNLVTDRLRGDANFQRIFGIELAANQTLPVSFFLDALHPDDLAETLRRIEATIERDDRYETEYRIRHADGSERWVIARGGVDRDEASGKATRFSGVLLDISDRKRAEAERRDIADEQARQARIYETILSTTDDFAYIFDLEGRVLYANRSLLKVWGVTLEQAVGLTLVELGYPVWHAAMHRKEIDEVIRTRRPIQGEIPFTGANGIAGVYDYVFTPVIGPEGDVERVVGTTRDVTERRAAEDATRLAAGRARFYAELAEATRDLLDPSDVVVVVAQRLGEYLGVSRCAYADVAEDQNTFTIHPEYLNVGVVSCAGEYQLDQFGTRAASTLRAGRTLVIRDSDAEFNVEAAAALRSIDVLATISCTLVRGGRLVAMMAVHQTTPRDWSPDDVSLVESVVERTWAYVERARGVRALAESEGRFRQLADAMPQIVWAARPDGSVDYFNRRWYEYTGLPAGDVIGDASWEGVMLADELPAIHGAWSAALESGNPYEYRYRVRRADGAYRWHLARGLPVRDPDGLIIRWYGTNTDIHAQQLAEAELRNVGEALARQGRFLDAALSSVSDFTYSFDRDGRFTFVSQQLLELWGLPLEQALGKTFVELGYEPELAARLKGQIDEVFSTRRTVSDSTDYVSPTGVVGSYEYTFTPVLMPDGTVQEVAGSTRNTTERTRFEQTRERLLASEQVARTEAERQGRMKDEFLATLSHELRTPLSAILGWSQMLARDGVSAESLRKGLATIERNARVQTQIIEDLLDMSRIISGKVALDSRRILLADVVRAAVETVAPTATTKQIDLIVDLGAEPTPVLGDPNRLQQVFWNLLTNAVKFTARGGAVRVSLERRHSQWRVHVADTGEGIRADFLPFVFDRFRQADASTTRKHGGLGLGLAIVKQIVELHGGTVSVKSEGEGQGATFTVSVPMSVFHSSVDVESPSPIVIDDAVSQPNASLANAMAPAAETFSWDATQAERLAGIRVLVVDDEPDARAMLRHLLESCKAVVDEAANADAGVARFREFRPDVLVSDVGMPGENGYGMLARIRALGAEAGGSVPAVALTAYARADDRIRAIRAGFQLHVPKPVEPAELIASVASLIRRPTGAP